MEQSSVAIQQRLMDDLVSAGVKGIMVSAVDPKASTEGLNKVVKAGIAFVHQELNLIGVSDRIAVMHEGRIAGILAPDQFSEENVLLLAVGRQPARGAVA